MLVHQFQPRPKRHARASRSEIRQGRLIADLRRRRQMIMNRIHLRTEVWAANHPERKRA